jgi:hypothetical protein
MLKIALLHSQSDNTWSASQIQMFSPIKIDESFADSRKFVLSHWKIKWEMKLYWLNDCEDSL